MLGAADSRHREKLDRRITRFVVAPPGVFTGTVAAGAISVGVLRNTSEVYYHDGWDIDSVDETQTVDVTRRVLRQIGPTVQFIQTTVPESYLTRRAWFTMAGTDEPLTMTGWDRATGGPSATSYYYSADHLGSVRALHDDNGVIVADLDTDTSGNREVTVESVQQPSVGPGASMTGSPGCITTAAAITTRTARGSCKKTRSG
jgi:hypothetical protein